MGGHAWDFSTQPGPLNPWKEPIWLMGPYDGGILFYETMVPLTFITGNTDTMYKETFTYAEQTIKELPTNYSLEYDAQSGYVTVTFEGNSACKKGSKSTKAPTKKGKNSKKSKRRV